MTYRKRYPLEKEWIEITRDDARRMVVQTYGKGKKALSMLDIGNYIPCRYAELRIVDDQGRTAMPGLMCLIP